MTALSNTVSCGFDYIGIKKQMNLALDHYSKADSSNIKEVEKRFMALVKCLKAAYDICNRHQASRSRGLLSRAGRGN